MNRPPAPLLSLNVSRRIRAPRARVFAAWTTPADLLHWFGPGDFRIVSAEVDLRPGGAYRFRFRHNADGSENDITGVYREIQPQARLVFTWKPENNPRMNFEATLVTVDFTERDGMTEVKIHHTGFPSDDIRSRHIHGWELCCDNLEKLLAAGR